MKKVILQMSVSADGYFEGPNHEIDWHLVDDVRIILTPILLGRGNTLFEGIRKRYPLRLLSTRTFKSGNVVLIYQPALR